MQKKDETFSNFIEFKVLGEKENNKKVNSPMINNAGEYVSNEFKNFRVKEGIR